MMSMMTGQKKQVADMASRVEAKGLYLETQARTRKSKLGMACDFETSKPMPSDLLSSVRTHVLNLLKQYHHGDQVFRHLSVQG